MFQRKSSPDLSFKTISLHCSGTIQLSDKTHKVPLRLHQLNRERLCARLKAKSNIAKGTIVLLQGGQDLNLYNTDIEYVFRQVRKNVVERSAHGSLKVVAG